MSPRSCLAIVLAAGEGTRMKSRLPKILHKVGGLEMLGHVIESTLNAGADALALVVGNGAEQVSSFAEEKYPGQLTVYTQEERLGTAHAALSAREAMTGNYADLLVVFGDHPLLDADDLKQARESLASGASVAVLGFYPDDATGYGRLIEKDGRLIAIREDKDCSPEEKLIKFCNSGVMAIAGDAALGLLEQIRNDNAKGEYYLTDIVAIANAEGLTTVACEAGRESAMGVNNRQEMAQAEALWQARKRHQAMLSGVTLIDPETVYFSYDTELGPDVLIEPNVWFGPGVHIEAGAEIRAFSHLEGAYVKAGASVGPFARLRPGAVIGEQARVGNFCEVKNSELGRGTKLPHLSYIGDANIGSDSNIGAGTITCNYDGFSKFRTVIGSNVFVGTNSSLVAPITIGDGAYIASGSVVTNDVPKGALAFGRARQTTYEGRGTELKEKLAAEKTRRSE